MKNSQILSLLLMMFVAVTVGCTPSPPEPGFRISTTVTLPGPFGFPTIGHYLNAPIFGSLQSPRPNFGPVSGNVNAFLGNTQSRAYYDVDGGVAPADWNMGFGPNAQFCPGRVGLVTIVTPGEDFGLDCLVIPIFFFTVDPAVIEVDYPPPSVTIYGSDISSIGGMPTVEYYNSSGAFVALRYASAVASDGTWLTSATPDLSSVPSGRYLLVIRNPDGAVAGNAFVDIYSYFEPPQEEEPDYCDGSVVCPEDPPQN